MGMVNTYRGWCSAVEYIPMSNQITEPVIEARELSFVYAGNIVALDRINFSIAPGELVALVGANGSGKSTLLKLIDGLLFPTRGNIFVFGQPLSEITLRNRSFVSSFRQRVGMVFQDADVQLFSATVWDEVIFGPMQLRLPREEVASRAWDALEKLGISHLRERPPYRLSGGEKKIVALACVLSMRPQVMLLDEPTSELDPKSQGKLIDFLLQWSSEGNNLVFSTQDLDLVEEIANRVIVLGSGHGIEADGRTEELLSDADFLLKMNLIHEHSHRHKSLIHRHPHARDHHHSGQ
jgi:cobalt/nickel transport system ATP-binding protein